MNTLRYLTMLMVFLCFSCKNVAQNSVSTAYLAETNPEKLEAYKKQQHRFSVDFCKLYYNEQQVILDSVQKFDNLFGKNSFNSGGTWFNKETPIIAYSTTFVRDHESKGRYITKLSVQLNRDPNYDEEYARESMLPVDRDSLIAKMPLLHGYIMIDGILVDGNTKIEDFNAIREKKDLPLYTQNLGNIASQGVTYDVSYCKPVQEMSDDYGYTNITLYYNEEDEFEETHRRTNIFQFRYDYSYNRKK